MPRNRKKKQNRPLPARLDLDVTKRIRTMTMAQVLPKDGFKYAWIGGDDMSNGRRILPASMATKIMLAFNQRVDKPKPAKFDAAVAKLIKSGEQWLRTLLGRAQGSASPTSIPDDAEFWDQPRKDTVFACVKKEIVYQFVLKLLEAREAWADQTTPEQILQQAPRQGETAQALDSFSKTVLVAAAASPDIAGGLAVCMTSLAANQVEDDGPEPEADPDLSEDELGVRTGEILEDIEEWDAFYVFGRQHEGAGVAMHDFVDTARATKIMADRAPVLAGLLDGSRLPRSSYEYTLERHLIARGHRSGELDEAREAERRANRERVLEASCRQDDDSRRLARQVASVEAALMAGAGSMSFMQGEEEMDADMDVGGEEMDWAME